VLAGWPLLRGTAANNLISINGAPASELLEYFLNVSPGWLDAMKVPAIAGRDFRDNETAPGVAVVTKSFAKQYFDGENPVGKSFQRRPGEPLYQIVGLVGDVRYRRIREPILPIAFVPFQSIDAKGAPRAIADGTFIVRTSSANPLALASILRAEVSRARPEFGVRNIRTQAAIKEAQTVRERLLATLGAVLRECRAGTGQRWAVTVCLTTRCCNDAARSGSG
jgi:putative ABC transport system permease protein